MVHARKRRKRAITALIIVLLFAAALIIAISDSAKNISVERYTLNYSSLPASFNGFKILQLSDLHNEEFGTDNKTLLKKCAAEKPDIIAVTGDIIDSEGKLDYARTLFEGLSSIAPVYFVAGNHEWASHELPALRQVLNECGIKYLSNSYDVIQRGEAKIIIAGLEDPCGYADMEKPEEFFARLYAEQGKCFTVLLSHRNQTPNYYAQFGPQLVLSGHAHGGLIRLPFTDGLIDASRQWLPDFTNGPYRSGDTILFVSRGLGNSTAVPRLFNRPHLPAITLRCR